MGVVHTTLPLAIQAFIFIDDNGPPHESFQNLGSFSFAPS